MEFLGFKNYWNDFLQSAETQVVMFRDKGVDHDTIVVCFRGTQKFNTEDWCSDVDLSWFEFPHFGKIHSGFSKALGMQSGAGWAKQVVSDSTHGPRRAPLGGALAAIFPAILFYHDEQMLLERMEGVYTFDQPRVGDNEFGDYMAKNLRKHGVHFFRYVYCNDMVPRVPFDGVFKHFGTCVYYNSKYQPYLFGMRILGLLNTGIPAHRAQNYVNSTRLGSLRHLLFHHFQHK
ncbi:hypothetical protein F3Y22_tig00112523pilonHSYRG00170 [Hibiscus syriacus]|uniref:Fungal lipase-type domain-containing protein n=1 Tax=Hibiscus syriacus TaxID=106335 RepID=A0A6A2WX64_HIBSY|nr:hypothetical protein F3Y22_tig00112523pilonHSYRG00170 [Hibiscus syriacus]